MVILNLNFVLGVKVMIVMIVEPAIKEIWFEKWLFWPCYTLVATGHGITHVTNNRYRF